MVAEQVLIEKDTKTHQARAGGISGVRFHDLRHFAATGLLSAGVDVRTVPGRLGHANAATTLGVYAHFLESSDQAAAAILAELVRPVPATTHTP